jgi:hypothetical protein
MSSSAFLHLPPDELLERAHCAVARGQALVILPSNARSGEAGGVGSGCCSVQAWAPRHAVSAPRWRRLPMAPTKKKAAKPSPSVVCPRTSWSAQPRRPVSRRAVRVPIQSLALERRVVDLLELLEVLSANASLAAVAARADGREQSRELAVVLDALKMTTRREASTVGALENFLRGVSPQGPFDDEPGARSCTTCEAPCSRKAFEVDGPCAGCRRSLKTGRKVARE